MTKNLGVHNKAAFRSRGLRLEITAVSNFLAVVLPDVYISAFFFSSRVPFEDHNLRLQYRVLLLVRVQKSV